MKATRLSIITRTVLVLLGSSAMLSWGIGSQNQLEDSWLDDYNSVQNQINQKKLLAKSAAEGLDETEVVNKHALIWPSDRTVLDVQFRRTEALIEDLSKMPGGPDLTALKTRLQELRALQHVGSLAKTSAQSESAEQDVYMALRKVARAAALSNPLLNFSDILFVERSAMADVKNSEANGRHMCDQFFGHNGRTGGGLYILKDFKGGKKLVNVVEGTDLSKGAFISPDLSWDGKTIVFGWASGGTGRFKKENRFNIYKVNIDGTGLKRLTNENHDDFDPCWLPNGRIAFISTRRGGFGRCHAREVPTFTLYSMKDDGTDIICLSYHETNEWQPSVDNDGMIVYTRWDYVDRESNVAHHLWTCFPDGRDPRAPHGNYPWPLTTQSGAGDFNKKSGDGRKMRPWGEWNIRAIPNSTKYVGVAGPHHNQAYGSLISIDLAIEDDNAMSQIKRLTPDVKFPEAEGGKLVYGTPWALSEDYFLANMNGGMYLIDSKGNKDLIYKAKGNKFRALDPIPVMARDKPNIIPTQTWQGERDSDTAPKAVISVMNGYISDMKWPNDMKPKEMRIVQIFPKSTWKHNNPVMGRSFQGLAHMSLGTVPIEEDGSIYCEAPVGKEIYFQFLDEKGLAINSMRSGTYVHAGEHLSCVGCHENKWEAIPPIASPKALMKPPAELKPELGILEPGSYYRLAKPVFDKQCTPCHKSKGGPNMSYGSLKGYTFYFHGSGNGNIKSAEHGGSRVIPGHFGARASKLYKGGYLSSKHYDVKLTPKELRMVTMWLDLNSMEYGAYIETGKQKNGELVWPKYDLDPNNPQGVERHKKAEPNHTLNQIKPANVFIASVKQGLIEINFHLAGKYAITISTLSGKTVKKVQSHPSGRAIIPVPNLKPGIYFIRVKDTHSETSQKIALL